VKSEIIAACCGAVVGSGATFGGDVIKNMFFEPDDPLGEGIVELSHISKELMLEQKALTERIGQLAENTSIPPEVRVEIGDIVNRVENIVQTTVKVESQTRNVAGLAKASRSANESASFNANADLVLVKGQAVTVCGNENTLGVESYSGSNATLILNGSRVRAAVGAEYKFATPTGPALVSFLGHSSDSARFRIVCGTELAK